MSDTRPGGEGSIPGGLGLAIWLFDALETVLSCDKASRHQTTLNCDHLLLFVLNILLARYRLRAGGGPGASVRPLLRLHGLLRLHRVRELQGHHHRAHRHHGAHDGWVGHTSTVE